MINVITQYIRLKYKLNLLPGAILRGFTSMPYSNHIPL